MSSAAANGGHAVFVTGAASGIGLAVARGARSAGLAVAMLDVDPGVERLASEMAEASGASVAGVVCDVRGDEAVASAFETAVAKIGEPTGLVTAAGIDRAGYLHSMASADWDAVLAVNLRGTFLACRAALRYMVSAGAGSIVCISSPFARVAPAGGAGAYCASKGAVCALVRALAVDYAPHGIRVNALLPGPTETKLMWSNVPANEVPEARATIAREVPLGRLADPGEPAAAAMWLLSNDAAYVTGTELVCDAGVLAKASVTV